jgi:heptaprenyl diphosphate synthase
MSESVTDWFESHIAPTHLFLSGFAVVPSFLLLESLLLKSICIALFAVLCFVTRRRPRPLLSVFRSVVLIVAIGFVHLLTPAGRIIMRVRGFPLTEMALASGLYRGLTLVGLFYISFFFVRRDIRLPGLIGSLIGRIFYYFNLLLRQPSIDPKKPIESIDRILIETYGGGKAEKGPARKTTGRGFSVIGLLVALGWSFFLVDRICEMY